MLLGSSVPGGVSIQPVSGPPAGSTQIIMTKEQDKLITESAVQSQIDYKVYWIFDKAEKDVFYKLKSSTS